MSFIVIYTDDADSCYCRKSKVANHESFGFGSGFSQIADSGSEKIQNPAGVDSGTPDPWPPESG